MNEALTAKSFVSDQEVRWCPGCGDYAILKAVRATLAEIGRPPHEVVFISGIGCAARFPYYIESYGFHTIHGRAPAVATGVRMANPDADLWVVGGDGDMLSIGGNHLIHALRRDIDMNILLFNNAIYGLTKGQYSPTSPIGTVSPTSPRGSHDKPVNAALLALGAGAGFVARSADTMIDQLSGVLKRAHDHRGTALVEIFQNCIVYYDGVWGGLASKATRHEKSIAVEHGKPLIYGEKREKGLKWSEADGCFDIIVGAPDEVLQKATIFDETNLSQAIALAHLEPGLEGYPAALGVLYCRSKRAEIPVAKAEVLDAARLQNAICRSDTWHVGRKA